MGKASTVGLAFRLHGSFAWPPVPDTAASAPTRDGVVEIWYPGDPGAPRKAMLRFADRPMDGVLPGIDGTTKALSLPELSDDAVAHWAKQTDKPLALWIKGSAPKVRLVFRGVRLIEQFGLDDDTGPRQRWVLARRYAQGNTDFFSEVVIGGGADEAPLIRFNLALPTPVPQGMVGGQPMLALPFSLTYPAVLAAAAPAGPIEIATFQAGSTARGSIGEGGDYPLPLVLKGRVLGSFGFCRSDGGAEFLFLPRSKDAAARKRFWLDDERTYLAKVLHKLGDMRNFPVNGFTLPHSYKSGDGALGELATSVRFVDGAPGSGRSKVVFRSTIAAGIADSGGDLEVVGLFPATSFRFRHRDDPNKRIQTGSSRMIVEHEVDYAIGDDDVWDIGGGSPVSASVTVRLGFDVTSSGDLRAMLNDASDAAQRARRDIGNIHPDQPQSALPEIAAIETKSPRLALTATIAGSFDADGRLQWGVEQAGPGWAGGPFRLTTWPADRLIGPDRVKPAIGEATGTLAATLRLPGLAGGDGKVTEVRVRFAHDPAPAVQNPMFCQFRLLPDDLTAAGEAESRLGGLAFGHSRTGTIETDPSEAGDYSHLRFGRRALTGADAEAGAKHFSATEIDVRLRLPVKRVAPVGVDVPWGERSGRQPPLLIPLERAGNSRFILDLRETVSATSDRHLTARLTDVESAAPGDVGGFVLIGQEPFSVTKVYSPPLGKRGSADNAQVASFDSDTRQWELKLAAQDYHYVFPPQVAGEGMDKPGMLEIHDRDPAARGPWMEDAPDGATRMRAVDYRLSPSAEIWIDPSDVERNYVPPEWATDTIFWGRAARGVGSSLRALRAEFLYGLAVGVDTRRETGIGRGARIAEIAALTGRPLRRPTASAANGQLARRWADVSRAMARRPERLEIWSPDPASDVAFSPARFSDGVSFALRSSAVHAQAVRGEKRPETAQTALRMRAHGLKGGALWPVESANLYWALRDRPDSEGGSIERIALSPVGGDADQKALFLDRKVAIVSETRNGFVQRHKVEVLGRIAVFWHRAKHVVVYERTVNPSAQFAPESDTQGTRTRRPVLRKVSEYIELLQPVRSYPDFADIDPKSSGFLDRVRFNSTIINVDSAWSEEVGTDGWQVPLWDRGAARKRPHVYPRPDIGFVTHAEGDGERPTAAQEALDADNLYFFADFVTPSDDTDSWPARLGVDYSALPAPTHQWQAPLGDSPDKDSPQPSGRRVPRGHRRFTWRLGPAAQKTMLNASRANQPIFAGIETLSFMRSSPRSDLQLEQKLAAAIVVADAVQVTKPLPLWTGAEAPEFLKETNQALSAFATAQGADLVERRDALVAAIRQELTVVELGPYAKAVLEGVGQFDTVKALVGDLPKSCDKLTGDFLATLRRKELLILDGIGAWENKLYATVDTLTVGDLKRNWAAEAKALMLNALSDMGTDRLGIGSGVEAARAAIRDFESDVLALESRAKAGLEEVRRRYKDGKPWSDGRFKAFLKVLETERKRLRGDIGTALADARARLATHSGDLAQRIGAVPTIVLDRVEALADDLLHLPEPVLPAGDLFVEAAVKDAVEKIESVTGHIAKAVETALAIATDTADGLVSQAAQLNKRLQPVSIVDEILVPHVITPAIAALFVGLGDEDPIGGKLNDIVPQVTDRIRDGFARLDRQGIEALATGFQRACAGLGGGLGGTLDRLRRLGTALPEAAEEIAKNLAGALDDVDKLKALQSTVGAELRATTNELAAAKATAGAYAERVIEAAGQLGTGGIAAVPGNIGRLAAAAAGAPSLPNLGFARDRLNYYYRELNDIIDTTPAEAWFGRLGDELKALGLSLPFSRLGERLLPDDLSTLDIERVLKNFGGVKLAGLFKGYRLPKAATDAIRLSHAFDRKAGRAWVAIDINLPMPERRTLFAVGPFALDFVNSRLICRVRLEEDFETGQVEQEGRAGIGTDIEALVGGQKMVSLEKVAIRFDRSGGLKVELDPANIKLNPSLQFIQDTLGQIFPDEVGVLKVIKQNGIPVGVSHDFAMPPLSLMYGTSGVSNIQIANAFSLVAYPDFVISDRFTLSSPDLPFLFSIFVIGGTGYLTVDTEYRPLDRQLSVVVEAAVGGSAAVGFSFGPVSGSVFITLSLALAYRHLPGRGGGGLTVSLVLLVAGNVSVAGLVTIYIGLLLRMAYRDNGQIDGTGTLTVTIRISRFFKISVRANVQYRLRNGRSETRSSVSGSGDVTDPDLIAAKTKAEKLLNARG